MYRNKCSFLNTISCPVTPTDVAVSAVTRPGPARPRQLDPGTGASALRPTAAAPSVFSFYCFGELQSISQMSVTFKVCC